MYRCHMVHKTAFVAIYLSSNKTSSPTNKAKYQNGPLASFCNLQRHGHRPGKLIAGYFYPLRLALSSDLSLAVRVFIRYCPARRSCRLFLNLFVCSGVVIFVSLFSAPRSGIYRHSGDCVLKHLDSEFMGLF